VHDRTIVIPAVLVLPILAQVTNKIEMDKAPTTLKEKRVPAGHKPRRHSNGSKDHGGFDHRSDHIKAIPKKGGSGSCNWGKPGEEYEQTARPFLDAGDPSYDPDEL
jgi:hypothetical protein